jgi:drug/metabolite transporter (DMT)-like permease
VPRPATARRRTQDLGLAAVASLAFATSSPLAKLTAPIPIAIVGLTCTGLAAVVLGTIAGRQLAPSLRAMSTRQRLQTVLAGALLGGHFALFLAGLQATSLAAAVALVSLEPVGVVLAAFVAFRLKPTRRELSGLLLATVGAAIVASGAGSGEHRIEGDLMELGAVLLYGGYVAAARGLKDAIPSTPSAASVNTVAALGFLPLALQAALAGPAFSARAATATLGLALVPTLLGYTLVQLAARRSPPVLVALISPGETIGSLVIGAVLMSSPPTMREGIGAVCVIVGALISVTGETEEMPEGPSPAGGGAR